jgi:hypothetical protein
LTRFSKSKRSRGRAVEVLDDELLNSRADLLFVLEENWARVGWELQRASTTEEIRAALCRIKGFNCSRLDLFRRGETDETTSVQFRNTRKQLQKLRTRIRKALPLSTRRKELADWALAELNGSTLLSERDASQREFQSATYKLERITGFLRRIQQQAMTLTSTVERQEAYLAQTELLEFIESDRYASTPVNFANAMAGIPRISWRISSLRCAGLHKHNNPGLTYSMFEVVAAAFKSPTTDLGSAIDQMKARLLASANRHSEPHKALRSNWYFLRTAIETKWRSDLQPVESIPYRVFAEYQRLYEVQSPQSVRLASRNRL